MLPNPLTPPNEYSAEAVDTHNGFNLVLDSIEQFSQQDHSIATPISNINMGCDSMEERSEVEDRSDSNDLDDDQDMSDGGAPLTMTLSHAEDLNAEMDLLDAEVMGAGNLAGMILDNHFPSSMLSNVPYVYADDLYPEDSMEDAFDPNDDVIDHVMDDGTLHGVVDTSDIPTTMSELSQQLQHLQDGQEHADLGAISEEHGEPMPNSTQPLLLPSSSAASVVSSGIDLQADFVSLAEISSLNQPSAALWSQNSHHTWGTVGWTSSLATNVLVPPQGHLVAPHLPSSDLVWVIDNASDADLDEVDDQVNLSLGDFLYNWGMSSSHSEESKRRARGPALSAIHRQRFVDDPEPVRRCDLQGEKCDIQRINWSELGVSRLEARQMRRQTYKNYTNLRYSPQWHPRLNGARLSDDEDFFKFRQMDFHHNIHLSHFQLRNLVACPTRDHVFYAGKSRVLQWSHSRNTESKRPIVAIDLTNPEVLPMHSFFGGVQISTLNAGHDVLVAGGFCGEYGLMNLKADRSTKHTEGIVTDNANSITNHVQVHLSRNSSLPLAAFASNDNGVRVLDCNTNKFIAEHEFEHAINCSAISPDQRLRVLVGDTCEVMICNSETGEILQKLDGHRDYGFACDWADDGWTVATGNQDMQVKIWDARKWTTSQGIGCPIATIAAEMAGVRKLKFSPVGSGKRVLVAAEPADFINVIDAETFSSKQTLSFFGEIGGVDFTNDGQDLFVANCDNMRGGLMEFERCNLASEGLYGLDTERRERKSRVRSRRGGQGYDWMPTAQDVVRHPKARGTTTHHERRAAALGMTMGAF